jgi:hypothetical protein
MKKYLAGLFLIYASCCIIHGQASWEHISSSTGALEVPNAGKQQTSAAVADFDNDGINDFCISERTTAPGLVWYRRSIKGWKRYIVEPAICYIEAGTTSCDVDNDGEENRSQIMYGGGRILILILRNPPGTDTL